MFLAHDIPGRFRLRVPALKGRTHEARKIEARLQQVPGVHFASVNPVTGSVLVEYGPPATCKLAILRNSGLLELSAIEGWNAPLAPAPAPSRLASTVAEHALNAVSERLVELAIKAAAAAFI